jgi:DNA transformation protein and related proteins
VAGASVETLRGLGPKSREMLRQAGIVEAGQVLDGDAVALYLKVKARQPAASLNLLYGLIGAQEDRDWREVARERRTELLLRLDDLGQAPRRASIKPGPRI